MHPETSEYLVVFWASRVQQIAWCGRRKGAHRNVGVDRHTLPPQLCMVLDSHAHVQVARGPSAAPRVALAAHAQARAVLHAARDGEADALGLAHAAIAPAAVTGCAPLPGAHARLARLHLLERPQGSL